MLIPITPSIVYRFSLVMVWHMVIDIASCSHELFFSYVGVLLWDRVRGSV